MRKKNIALVIVKRSFQMIRNTASMLCENVRDQRNIREYQLYAHVENILLVIASFIYFFIVHKMSIKITFYTF